MKWDGRKEGRVAFDLVVNATTHLSPTAVRIHFEARFCYDQVYNNRVVQDMYS